MLSSHVRCQEDETRVLGVRLRVWSADCVPQQYTVDSTMCGVSFLTGSATGARDRARVRCADRPPRAYKRGPSGGERDALATAPALDARYEVTATGLHTTDQPQP